MIIAQEDGVFPEGKFICFKILIRSAENLKKLMFIHSLFFITLARKPQPFKAGDEGCPERSGGRIASAFSHRNHGL